MILHGHNVSCSAQVLALLNGIPFCAYYTLSQGCELCYQFTVWLGRETGGVLVNARLEYWQKQCIHSLIHSFSGRWANHDQLTSSLKHTLVSSL